MTTSIEKPSHRYRLLSEHAEDEIRGALVSMDICEVSDAIHRIARAGDGNMNLVLRVKLANRSVILKQSRPWVEKYPSIAAPEERILAELDFYNRVKALPNVSRYLPEVLAEDIPNRTIVMTDLGESSEHTKLYRTDSRSTEKAEDVFSSAIDWLGRLHQSPLAKEDRYDVGCFPLRQLNHQHIFAIPLQPTPSIDLDGVCQGLHDATESIRTDVKLRETLLELGDRYLAVGDHLLHGDFYPGSWLDTAEGFRVIDPEFCYAGPPEFDLGVLAAHWMFCGYPSSFSTIDRACKLYRTGDTAEVSPELIAKFAAAELIRRLIGVAQLPLSASLNQRMSWLETARSFLR